MRGIGGRSRCLSIALLFHAALAPAALAQWVEFNDETPSRLNVSDPGLVLTDVQEKDYAWGDFDNDGDVDLVIMRKEPQVSAGKEPNVLLINEGGVLTDRTAEYASASDVAGDQGFLTPTNDRDAVVVDVDLDGWLDVVTAPTLSVGDPKHIGHPRVYYNLGCSGACAGTEDWLGFEYQDARIPEMLSWSGQSGFNPCLCHIDAGDATGDGYPELWLVDYDDGCGQPGADFNSRLLINQGAANPGVFTDETLTRFLGTVGGLPFPVNVDSLSGYVADLNGDGANEIILESEGVIDIAYNDPLDEGYFDTYDAAPGFSTYFMNVAELNNDGLLDLITTDDGSDRYFLNQGNDAGDIPQADFLSFIYSFSHTGLGGPASDDGFGDITRAADLNHDGWSDVVTADVDFTFPGCSRRAHIYHNLGGQPGDNVVIQEETTGSGCEFFFGNPSSCLVASIPADKLEGTFDIAIFDIDGDTWLDLVIGRCSGTEIYINQPPAAVAGGVPNGDSVPGAMMALDRLASGEIELDWGESCLLDDTDYAVYEGVLGDDFEDHYQVACTTAGATQYSFEPSSADTYYLVVPHNGDVEGSYGVASSGDARQQGLSSCLPMNAKTCD